MRSRPNQGGGDAGRLAAHTLGLRVISYAVGIPGSIMLARGLGPSGRGAYQIPVTITTVLVFVASAGTPQALFRYWRPDQLRRLRAHARPLAVGLGAFGVGLGLVVLAVEHNRYLDAVPAVGYVLVLVTLPLQVHLALASGLVTYSGAARDVNVAGALAIVVQTVGFVVGALAGWLTVSRTCAIYLVGSTVQWWWVARSARRLEARKDAADATAWWPLVRTGLGLQPYIIANFLLLRIDVLLLGGLGTFEDVGRYAVAVALAELVWNVTDAILVPTVERASNTEDAGSDRFTGAAARMTLLLGGAGACAVGFASPLVIPVLYGQDFGSAVGVVAVLLPGALAMALWRVGSLVTLRFGAAATQATISLGALVLNVVLNVVLIPPYGAVGAGIASSVSYAAAAGATLVWIVHRSPVTWGDFVPRGSDVGRVTSLVRGLVGHA